MDSTGTKSKNLPFEVAAAHAVERSGAQSPFGHKPE
jgi:hypothetical protein